MSTAQDHKRIAAELTDVFGPGAGESGTLGTSGEEGRTGSPITNILSTVTSLAAGNRGGNAADLTTSVLANPNASLEELENALEVGKSAQNTLKSAAKFGAFAGGAQTLGAAGKVLGGELGTGGSAALTGLKTAVPGVGMASGVGSLFGKYDLINPPLNKAAELVNELPGMKYFNEGLKRLGTGISEIPGTGTASLIAGGLSAFPDEILSAPAKIIKSITDADEVEASDRDAALTRLFTQEGSDGRLYISPPTTGLDEEVLGVDLPGTVNPAGVGSYSGRYNFPADEGQTRRQLFEEFQNSETYRNLVGEQQGIRDLEEIEGQEALEELDIGQAIRELTDPVKNIVPIKTYVEDQRGTHYRDEYGTYDVETGEKLPDPYDDVRTPPPMRLEDVVAPVAPEAEYQAPRQPKAVEIAPMSRSDGSVSFDGGLTWSKGQSPMPRVRPEELVTPEKSIEQKMHEYRMAQNPRYQSLQNSFSPHRSMAHTIDLTGLQTPASLRPKHNLRELPTGLNASSY